MSLFALVFLSITHFTQTDAVVLEVEVDSNYVSILFDRNIDTTVSVYSTTGIYPDISGYWKWHNNRQLNFIGDSCIPDTAVYVVNINAELKDTNGIAVGPTGIIFTGSKSISYDIRRPPLQWEDVSDWDVEADWRYGPRVYTIKPKLHSSYRSVVDVLFCWQYLYDGALRQDHRSFKYPSFTTSESRKYKAAVDSSGALYLIDVIFGLQYCRLVFPENLFYRALDVSDKGEVIIALSTSEADTTSVIYLLSPTGEISWAKDFLVQNHHDMMIDLRFINAIDKFLIYISGKIYCFKMYRRE